MKMRSITCFGDRTSGTYNCLCLSDEDNSVSRTDNLVNVNVNVCNSVTSLPVLCYRKSKLRKKRKINI